MTTIIGARLRDGRKCIANDGRMARTNDTIAMSNFDKTWELRAQDASRHALVGLAGKPSELILFGTAISTYALVNFPYVEDLFYRLSAKYKEAGIECKSSAVAWVPRCTDVGTLEHVLVHISSDFFTYVETRNFNTEGSGGVEARASLLGMALRDKPAGVSYDDHMKAWCPTEEDVRAAMLVAMNEDVFSGGTVFFHTL